ncbi:hypothetical protein V5O48_004158 [Marasmius crinis-equi]|uniref:Aryl-alcohol oxidase n=1 Tax=Marasmius crinis-equi TaxID=585013 RepID=A0ABR3FQW9_9AGAR
MPPLAGRPWVFLILFITSCLGALFADISALPQNHYDFVVIGGGTAGLVVANRLTENPEVAVLVIEAGVSNADVEVLEIPFFCNHASPRTPYDWNYTTVAQEGLLNRTIDYPRGHVLGGSSSINYMVYTRGSSEDYDRWADVTGDTGWSWKNIQSFILRNEKLTPPTDAHDTTGQYDPAVHGFKGINSDSLPGFATPIDRRVIQVTKEDSDEFPYNRDYNSGYHLGIGWNLGTIRNGTRSSSATSYLGPKYAARANLHVVLNSRVTRVLPTNQYHADLDVFNGERASSIVPIDTVEVATSADGPRTLISAKKEIILSAGSIGSTQILLNSGIGDSATLEKLGIRTILDNPSVGQNLSDHPLLGNSWFVNETETWEKLARNTSYADEQLELWRTARQGPLVNTLSTQIGWLRIADNSTVFQTNADPAAGPRTAHYEVLFANGLNGSPPPEGNFMTITTAVVSPASRGSVRLRSSNPFDAPLIDPNFYGSEFDLAVMKEAIFSARRFAAAKAWEGYIIKPLFNATTEEEVEAMIRNTTTTVFHPVGTNAMSAKDAAYGVVDPDLRVKGVSGLRIIDASVFPFIPAAHTQVPVYIVAERGSDLVKRAWKI